MIGSGNILRGASQQAIAMLNSQVTFTGNHIFSDGDFVRAYGYYSGLVELDFRNNYWGTSDPEEIAARILDGHDDPAELGYVIFEPFSDVPVGNEDMSWGEIKALFK